MAGLRVHLLDNRAFFSFNPPAYVPSCGRLLPQPNRFPQAILPVKKALGGDPEVAEARESLTKYKAKLSAAVAEAAAAAATGCVCA